jgi:two-component system chemotaxis sensor kinase CheA
MSDHLREIFRAESEDLLEELESGLVKLESSDDPELVNRVFRAAHTLKGNAGIVGEDHLVEFAHLLENLLDRLREKEIVVTSDLVSDLLAGADTLREMVEAVIGGGAATDVDDRSARRKLRGHLGEETPKTDTPQEVPSEPSKGTRVFRVEIRLGRDIFQTGQDPFSLLQELAELGTLIQVDTDTQALPSLAELDPHELYISWVAFLHTEASRSEVEGVFLFVEDENDIRIQDVTARIEDYVDLSAADQRIGELLVSEGRVSSMDLDAALNQQKPVGQLLVESGKVDDQALDKVLKKQELARSLKRTSSVKVSAAKLDKLLNLIGELVISTAQVSQHARDGSARLDVRRATAEALERITREIQEQVMSVRMVPVEESFSRFGRVVRDLAGELGKSVQLETAGTDTELDKTMVEQLTDPLKHMVRNCVDHGIETPDEREAAGKPPTGTVRLEAEQREGRILVRVSDDGRGVDRDRVLAKAEERGLVDPTDNLSDRQILDLLFHPGFSTAQAVTDISGRGVGLDVVRRNVEDVNGTIEIKSTQGQGTTFEILLPLTLAIIDGMTVRVGKERLTFPIAAVTELLYPKREDLRKIEGHRELVLHRGSHIPMMRLYEVFALETQKTDPTQSMVVVLEANGRTFGVMVDDVVGMEQAVVKSLDASFNLFQHLGSRRGRPRGIAGATIMGDGSVSLIIDVFGLERMALDDDAYEGAAVDGGAGELSREPTDAKGEIGVMTGEVTS